MYANWRDFFKIIIKLPVFSGVIIYGISHTVGKNPDFLAL